jgi:hypothetical protein
MLMHGPECQRIEETAKLEGIIFEQASQMLLLSVLGVLSQHYVIYIVRLHCSPTQSWS